MLGHKLLLWAMLAMQSAAPPLSDLELVGTARLKVMFWTVYDSSLFSNDGSYDGIEADLALRIEYRRKIANSRFIDATKDQWMELGVYDEQVSEIWLGQLKDLLPDVEKADVLTVYIDQNLYSNFYFNEQFIGSIDAMEFSQDFLSIWLAPDSSYPKLRAQLVGNAD